MYYIIKAEVRFMRLTQGGTGKVHAVFLVRFRWIIKFDSISALF